MTLDRRSFLTATGAGLLLTRPRPGFAFPRPTQSAPDVVVIGAGAFGGWTAYYLRRLGAKVTLVDAYGPGNSRATSGDETRGVRSSYGQQSNAAIWVPWAREAMARWKQFDEEWSRPMRMRLFFTTGDLIFRERDDPIIARNVAEWTKLKVPFEQPSVEDVAKEYPVIDLRRITKVLLEPDAGVVRARRACEVVAEACAQSGGEVVIGTAWLGAHRDGRLQSIDLEAPEGTRRAETFVFALGPWFPKFFPQLMGPRIRTPMGLVHYFGTPPHDDRFTFPNLPSWNFPGATGWPALPVDNRGFRARLTGERLYDPDTSQRAFARGKDKEPRQLLKERFPLLHKMPLLETRACHYELSTSRNFIIDRHPEFSNVWIAGGGSAEGFKFGPVVGEYVARRVLGEAGDPDLAEAFGLPMSEPEPAR